MSATRDAAEVVASAGIVALAGRRWDAVVVGAGPAGSAAALRLARIGLDVLLLDRGGMPRGKVCGCCLSPTALWELAALDRRTGADAAAPFGLVPTVLGSVVLAARGNRVRLPFPGGAVLSRESLDAALVRAAVDAGAAWSPRTPVARIEVVADGVRIAVGAPTVAAASRTTLEADVCVVATGLTDTPRCRGGADRAATPRPIRPRRCLVGIGCTLPAGTLPLPPGELSMAVGPAGYCGVVRLEDGRIDVAAAIDRSAVRASRGAAVAVLETLRAAGIDEPPAAFRRAVHDAAPRVTPPLTRSAAVAVGRIFRVGDAAGYVEPFTGEGIGWALLSARLLGEAFADVAAGTGAAPDRHGQIGRDYASRYRRHFDPRHARCRGVAAALRHGGLVSAAIRTARLAPTLAARIVPLVTGAAGRGGRR